MMFVFAALLAWGQTGTLSGTITNPDGKAVPGAVVTITNVATGMSQKVVTGTDGNFMVAIPPGSYKVEVETTGFKRMTAEAVVITAGTTARITAQLVSGPITEVVQINADTVDVQDTPPAIQRGFGQAPLLTLPIFDRNYEQLFNLMPGVTVPLSSVDAALGITWDPQRSRQFNTNGLPAYANNTTQEGTTLREPFTGVLTMQITPNTAIRELQETTSNYPADSGAAAGSINNVFSRPGTTGLHGELFGFNSNPYFQAGNPFNIAGNGGSTLHWWQVGAGVGGQIVPNHTFLYGNWEGTHYNSGNAQLATVPTNAMLLGNLSSFGTPIYNPFTGTPTGALRNPYFGGIIPITQINPLSFGILAALPAPNLPGIVNNLSRVVPFSDKGSVATGRLDQHFNNYYSGFLEYGFSYFNGAQGSVFGPIVGGPTSDALRNQHATLGAIGNYHAIIGELRFTYNRYRNGVDPSNTPGLLSPLLGNQGFTSMPTINIQGFGTLGQLPNLPNKMVDNTYQGAANFHMTRGIQDIRFGFDILATQANGWTNNYPFGPNGTLYFGPGPTLPAVISPYISLGSIYPNSLAAFLTGSPVAAGVFSYTGTPTYRQMLYGTYFGDGLRLTDRLTVELGVRWDIFSPTTTEFNNGAMVYGPSVPTVTYPSPGTVTYSNGGGSYDLRQVAPRIGVAYRPLEHTVIRASYGMYYFPVPNSFAGINQAGVGAQAGLINGSYLPLPTGMQLPPTALQLPGLPTLPIAVSRPAGATVAAPTIPLIAQPTGTFENPYTQSYFLMVQQQFTWGILADASYVGNVVRELPYYQSLNIAPPGTGPAGLPFASATVSPITGLSSPSLSPVTQLGTGLTSNYNSLHINVTKRLSHGFGVALAYTFSKALDYGTYQLNPFDRAANYGPADWNRQNMLTLSHHLDLPFGNGSHHLNSGIVGSILAGFQLNGMFQWGTGTPYSVLASPVSCNCPGVGSIFAAPVGPNLTSVINGNSTFNPALFTTPVPNTFGSAARNTYHGPGFVDYNLALSKAFRIAEQSKVEIRGEAINLTNSFNHGTPVANLALPGFGTPTALGSGLASGSSLVNGFAPRTFLVGARFLF